MSGSPISITSLNGPDIRIRILNAVSPTEAHAARVTAEWDALRTANPRYHDGPILLLHSRDPLTVRRDTYRTLATASTLDPTIRSLGVQALLIGRGTRRRTGHLLLGRRSMATRIYGDLWENAPSGSVPAPAVGVSSFDLDGLIKIIRDEGVEELGIDLEHAQACPIALLDDAQAMSLDIVFEIRPQEPVDFHREICPINAGGRWEYSDTAWIDIDDIRTWSRQRGQTLSPPTHALMKFLGWL